jgi:hypothetical protein
MASSASARCRKPRFTMTLTVPSGSRAPLGTSPSRLPAPLHITMRRAGKASSITGACASRVFSTSSPLEAVFRNRPTWSSGLSRASYTVASIPARCKAIAATGPPMPPPTIRAFLPVVGCWFTDLLLSSSLFIS